MAGELRAVFAVQTGEVRVLRSAANLIAAATENLQIELVCFGEGIFLALSGGPAEQDLISLMHTTQGPGGTVNITVTACRNSLTRQGLDAQAHPEVVVAGVSVVAAGVLQLTQHQREGWSYLSV